MKWAPDIINLVKPYPSQHHADLAEPNIKISSISCCWSQQDVATYLFCKMKRNSIRIF